MSIELQGQQKIIYTNGTESVSTGSSVVSEVITVPVGQSGNPSEIGDTVHTYSSSSETVPTQKRSIEELYKTIEAVLKANGLDINEAKKIGLLNSISGKTDEELMNAEQSEINQILTKLKNAINAIKEDIGTNELSFDLIKKYNRLLNGEIPMGWSSVEEFRKFQKRNSESLTERLNRFFACDISKLNKEQLADKLERYFDNYFEQMKTQGFSKEKIQSKQLTDFSKLLFNSSPKEYNMFRDALEYLVAKNRNKGYEAILESFETQAEKTKFSNETSYEYVEKLNTKPDKNGDIPTVEDIISMTSIVLKDKDAEHIAEYRKAASTDAMVFYTPENKEKLEEIKKNPEIIAKIQAKLLKGEELTEQEKEYLEVYAKDQHHKGDLAGQFIGIGTNRAVEEETLAKILEELNIDSYNIGKKAGDDFYRNILNKVAEKSYNLKGKNRESFDEIMNKAVGENYSKVVKDVAVGSKSELVAPTSSSSSSSTSTSLNTSETNNTSTYSYASNYSTSSTSDTQTNFGYQNTSLESRLETIYSNKKNITNPLLNSTTNSNTSKDTNIINIANGNIANFMRYIHEKGDVSAISEVFNNLKYINNDAILIILKPRYEKLSPDQQEAVLKSVTSSEGFNALLAITPPQVIIDMDTNFSNEYFNDRLEEAQKEAREKLEKNVNNK